MKKIFTSSIRSFLVFIIFTSLIYPQQQPEYEIIRFGNGFFSAISINDSSEVVGIESYGNEESRPFLWKNGSITYIPIEPFIINNNSAIVGRVFPGTDLSIYYSDGSFEHIPLPSGFNACWPEGFNDLNVVAGYLRTINTDSVRAFIFDGTITVLPAISGFDTKEDVYNLLAINNSGDAVGNFTLYSLNQTKSYLWSNSNYTILANNSNALDINNFGEIAGKIGNQAVKWVNNIPQFFPGFSIAWAINDSSIMVGYYYEYPIGARAVKFVGDQIIDLNTLIPQDSMIVLTDAFDINNKGEILVKGYYYPNQVPTFWWLLRRPYIKITHPAKGELVVSGTRDSIMWNGGKANQNVDIFYSLDGGNSWEADLIAEDIPADTGKWHWEVPDELYSRKAIISIVDHTTIETVIESDTFRIKPLIITKLDQNGDYLKYDIDTDRWGFGNYPEKMWPAWYHSRFDYSGIDPFTGFQYDQFECGGVFYLADPKDFPDWESFVKAFSVEACYRSTVPPVSYSLAALERWAAKKRNWGGSCFGIAASNAMVFERRTDYTNHFPNISPFLNPINLTTPDTGDIAAISTLFTHQFGNPSKANDNVSYNIKTPNQTLFEIIDMLKEDSVKIKTLTIYNNSGAGAHTILAYQVEQDEIEPQYFYIWVYDNSYPNINNGIILIDTSANSGNGSWDVSYGWNNWGGTKNIYLEIPDTNYLNPAILNKGSQFQSPFIIKQNELEINNTKDASILIKDNSNNITGYQNNQVFSNISGSRPLFIKNGSEDPPYGYYLQLDNYEIEMKDFTVTNPSLYVFTDNKSFSVKRDDALSSQIDNIKYWPEQKLEINNPDAELKSFQLTEIINESVKEKMYILKNVEMNQNDLFEMKSIDEDKLKITNTGTQKNYEVELQAVSENGFGRFLSSSVNLPATSNHTILPDWADITNTNLTILVDIGNDGTIDDTLNLENEVTGIGDDQGLLLPTDYRLEQNYPNPFNNSTVIRYSIPKEGIVNLKVYSILGEEVATLVNENKDAGNYEVNFNASNLTSGVYFYTLQAGDFVQSRKMILLK